jgi:hypothetical protein
MFLLEILISFLQAWCITWLLQNLNDPFLFGELNETSNTYDIGVTTLLLANRPTAFAVSLEFFSDICIPGHLMQFGTVRLCTTCFANLLSQLINYHYCSK